VGEKCSDKFRLEFDFHVILEIFYMPQICDMGQTALLPLRRKAYWGFFSPLKIRRLWPGLNPRTWVPKTSTLPLDHRSRFFQICKEYSHTLWYPAKNVILSDFVNTKCWFGELAEWYRRKIAELLGGKLRKFVPCHFFPPQNPHKVAWDQTHISKARDPWRSSLSMARSSREYTKF